LPRYRLLALEFRVGCGKVSAPGDAAAGCFDRNPHQVQLNMGKQGFPEKNEQLTHNYAILN
jgi:hypothetical protein